MKKAQGLSLQVIVIGIIVLLVAAVLIGIFGGVIGGTVRPGLEGIVECSSRSDEAYCATDDERSDCEGTVIKVGCPEEGDSDDAKWCCIP